MKLYNTIRILLMLGLFATVLWLSRPAAAPETPPQDKITFSGDLSSQT